MEIPYSRWYQVIATRRSRRQYDGSRPIPEDILFGLQRTCAEFKPFPGARAEVITRSIEQIFRFMIGSYGLIQGATAATIFIGDMTDAHVQEKVGYIGQGIILEITALSLGSCWVGGFFRPEFTGKLVELRAKEKILAVSPVGYPSGSFSIRESLLSGFGSHTKRKPLSELTTGTPEKEWPEWVRRALEAARQSPSAINRQPWRFDVGKDKIIFSISPGVNKAQLSKRLDCGIAMLNFEVAALNYGVKGQWQFLDGNHVASFNY